MDKLPVETLTHIFNCLEDVKDLVHCSQVNKYFYNIININNGIWKKFCTFEKYLKGYESYKDKQDTMKPFCYWKWYYIHYERICNNWKDMNGRKYSLNLATGSNYISADCDGQTLAICYTKHLKVYKILNRQLLEFQTLSVPECMISLLSSIYVRNSFIVLNCGKGLLLYKLTDGARYDEVCMFYKKLDSDLTSSKLNVKVFKQLFFDGKISNIHSIIHGQCLYIFVQGKIIVWNLRKLICHIQIEAKTYRLSSDIMNIYISSGHTYISAYDTNGKQGLIFRTDWEISQIESNQEILLAMETEKLDDSDEKKVCVWNKHNGNRLYEILINLPGYCFLHTQLDILLGNVTIDNQLYAFSLNDKSMIWTRNTDRCVTTFSDQKSILGFRCLAADRLLVTILQRGQEYTLVDARNGTSLAILYYRIYLVTFDIMIYQSRYMNEIIVHIFT